MSTNTAGQFGDSKAGGLPAVDSELNSSPLIRALCRIIGWDWRRMVVAFALVIGLAVLRAPYTQVSDALFVSDGFGYYIWLPSIVLDHDLDLSNQLTRLPYEGEKHFFTVSNETGMARNQFPVGCAILWAPFFVLADWSVQALNAVGFSFDRSGFGWPYELPVYLGSFVYGLLAVWLMQHILRRVFPQTVADLSLVVVVFATPLAYYTWLEPNMSHTVAAFAITLWLALLLRIDQQCDKRFRSWLILGVVLGVVALVRPYNGVLGLVAIPTALRVCGLRGEPWVRRLCNATARLGLCCIVSLSMLVPQLYVWQVLYGAPFVVPDSSGYQEMAWTAPEALRYLSSVFVFSPVYLFAFVGLLCFWTTPTRKGKEDSPVVFARRIAPLAIVVLAIISYLVAASRDWDLGTAFGQRRLCDWAVFTALGVGLLLHRYAAHLRPQWIGGVALALIVVNCSLALLYLLKCLPQYGITV